MIPGEKKATVESHTWTVSDAKGTLGLRVVCMVHDDDGEMQLPGTIWFSDKSMGFARSQLKALGFDPDATEAGEIGETVDLIGNETVVQVEEQIYQGTKSLRIGKFGGARKPTPKALSNLSQSLRNAGSGSQVEPPVPDNDDIPF